MKSVVNGYVVEEVYNITKTLALEGNYDLEINLGKTRIYIKYSVGKAWVAIMDSDYEKTIKVIPRPEINDIEKLVMNIYNFKSSSLLVSY